MTHSKLLSAEKGKHQSHVITQCLYQYHCPRAKPHDRHFCKPTVAAPQNFGTAPLMLPNILDWVVNHCIESLEGKHAREST